MLVLSRKKNEVVLIGDNIEVMIVEVRGDVVKLGVTAPRDIPVYRQEVADRLREESSGNTSNETSQSISVKTGQ